MKIIAVVLLSVLISLAMTCCSPSSKVGANKARSLSVAQLEELYWFMEKHEDQFIYWGSGAEPLPENVKRAGVRYGDVGYLNRLVFGGCLDDKAALYFEGLRGRGLRRILLVPGERKEPEILWQEKSR